MKILASQEFNDFLKNYALWICLGILIVLGLTILFISLASKSKAKKNKLTTDDWSNLFFDSLGGRDNVVSYRLNGSRFSIEIKNQSLIKKEDLETLGVDNIIIMSNKATLVLNEKGKKMVAEFLNQESK